MENKEIIITVAIILVIAYVYWQNRQSNLTTQIGEVSELAEVKELQSQVNHYQKLYQQRVAKDLANESKIKELTTEQDQLKENLQQTNQSLTEWETRHSELESLNNQQSQAHNQVIKKSKKTNQLYLTKINDLETALFNLAKQKIKGKKEAEQLVKQLETNWKNDKKIQQQNHQKLTGELEKLKTKLTQKEQAIQQFNNSLQEKELKITDLAKQITLTKQVLTASQEQRKQEQKGFNEQQQELKKELVKQESDIKKQKQLTQQAQQTHEEQLRKINLLFDKNAATYQTIDFNGLYSLLANIQQEQKSLKETIIQTDNSEKDLENTIDNLLHQIKELQQLC